MSDHHGVIWSYVCHPSMMCHSAGCHGPGRRSWALRQHGREIRRVADRHTTTSVQNPVQISCQGLKTAMF